MHLECACSQALTKAGIKDRFRQEDNVRPKESAPPVSQDEYLPTQFLKILASGFCIVPTGRESLRPKVLQGGKRNFVNGAKVMKESGLADACFCGEGGGAEGIGPGATQEFERSFDDGGSRALSRFRAVSFQGHTENSNIDRPIGQ